MCWAGSHRTVVSPVIAVIAVIVVSPMIVVIVMSPVVVVIAVIAVSPVIAVIVVIVVSPVTGDCSDVHYLFITYWSMQMVLVVGGLYRPYVGVCSVVLLC